MDSLAEIIEIIMTANNYLILGHIDPDGDCIGSMVALKEILDLKNIEAEVLFYRQPGTEYDFLLPDSYLLYEKAGEELANWPKINIIALDAADQERLGRIIEEIEPEKIINIDHHGDNPQYGDYNYINADRAATGEIIYEMIKKLDIPITEGIGYALATAVLYDTGFLRHPNTTPGVLQMLATLMENNVDLHTINRNLYGNYSYGSLRLKGLSLSTIQRDSSGKIAWLFVKRDMLEEAGAEESAVSGLVNYALDIKGVEVGICFNETGDGYTKVSLRSRDSVPVNKIAGKFGGGGHTRAAGCLVREDLDTTVNKILEEVTVFVRDEGYN